MMKGQVRLLSVLAVLGTLAGCRGNSDRSVGTDSSTAQASTASITRTTMFKRTSPAPATDLATGTKTASAADKLIALTFDDGPRPYVLFGSKGVAPGLADILEQSGVKATFFVVGWRLTLKTTGAKHEEDIGVTCIDAAEQLIRRGHELEDHTFSHIELKRAERKKGEQWVLGDVDRGAQAIKAITGAEPRYLRPPDWMISTDARRELERHGYRLLSISSDNPMALRDVNSLDYLCAGSNRSECPKPSLADAVLKQVEQRERKGIYTHILAFHELSTTSAIMPELINDLKARGYRFVTVNEYMNLVAPKNLAAAK